jgi:predicted GTPase
MKDLTIPIETLRRLAAGIAGPDFFSELDELEVKLRQEKLYLVVVGLFKRGKSSLINAVIGKPLAPIAVTPVTAIVTLFEYDAGESRALIRYQDGRTEAISVDEVGRYISEDENPANAKQVRLVTVFDNAPILKPVTLVDTPGIGSSFEHNTATTLQFIPKIDAALFLLSADMPISRLDADFLKELKRSVPKIVFVMNKKDLLGDAELQKLMQHNIKTIAEIMQLPAAQVDLIAVSARDHEQGKAGSGMDRLLEKIRAIAAYEKTELLQQAVRKRYRWLHQQLLMQIRLKADSLSMPLHELEEKKEKLNASIAIMQEQKDEFESIIRGKIKLLQGQIDTVVNRESALIKTIIHQRLDSEPGISGPDRLPPVQQELDQLLLSRFEAIRAELEQLTKAQFRNLLQQYSARSQSFLNELATHLHALLGISFDMIADRFDLNVYTAFYLSLDSGLGAIRPDRSVLGRLLPASARRKQLINQLKEHYNNLIIRNGASIAYDLTYKIQESFRKFNYDLNNRLKELLESIRTIITDTIGKKQEAETVIADEIRDLKERMLGMEAIRAGGEETGPGMAP